MPTDPAYRAARILRLVRDLAAHHRALFRRAVRVSTVLFEDDMLREKRIMAITAAMSRTNKAKLALLSRLPKADVFQCDGRFWRVHKDLVLEVVVVDLGWNPGRRIG